MSRQTYDGYCPTCGTETPILKTVPYQADTCSRCGSDVPDEDGSEAWGRAVDHRPTA